MGARRQRRIGVPGFSLLEALVSLSIFLIVLYGVYMVYDVGEANYAQGSRQWDVQSQARLALERMAREIRMAGYSPAGKLADPIVIATDDTLSVHADLGEKDALGNPLGARYLTYGRRNCSGTDGPVLYRNVSTTTYCGGDAFIEGVTSLKFTYYELNGVMIPYTSPAQTTYRLDSQNYVTGTNVPSAPGIQRNAIRQVKIALTVEQQVGGVTIPFTTTTDVTLRNLVP